MVRRRAHGLVVASALSALVVGLGEEMAREIAKYRDRLSETPVELDVVEEPTANVRQAESWVELRLRHLVHPRRGTRARNAMYEAILERFNENSDRVGFPVSRSR